MNYDILAPSAHRETGGWHRGGLCRAAVVGPPSPVRRSKSSESGEWVTEAEPAEATRCQDPPASRWCTRGEMS